MRRATQRASTKQRITFEPAAQLTSAPDTSGWAIRGHGNKDTEIALMKLFRRHRITGWCRHQPVFGRPDFIFPKAKVAVFVDGCFWHGCPKHSTMPRNNRPIWKRKLDSNKARDRRVNRTLRKEGWRVVRIWEHDLAKRHEPRLLAWLGKTFAPHAKRGKAPA